MLTGWLVWCTVGDRHELLTSTLDWASEHFILCRRSRSDVLGSKDEEWASNCSAIAVL